MVSRVCNSRGRSTDDDDDDCVLVTVKKVLVEEKNRPTMKNESSQTTNQSNLQRCKRKRATSHSAGNVKLESKLSSCWSRAMVQAQRVQLSLGTKFPSSIKLLFKSHLEGHAGALLSLPRPFCRLHLPKDENLTLVDENEEKFEVKYLSKFRRFGSVGWKNFAVSHKLRERDVLVFHLVEPTKLKVYVIRGDDSSLLEQDGQGILKSPDLANQSQELKIFEGFESKRVKLPSAGKVKLERKLNSPAMVEANCIHLTKSFSFSKVKSPAMVQALRVQLSLGNKSPSFMKLMFKSHLERRAIVRLPLSFCKVHLLEDETIILEDEDEENFEVKYISKSMIFGAGWKKFVASHNLRERDVLVFHLVKPTKWKVYIIRADDHINANSSPLEPNEQGIPESSSPANRSQQLGKLDDFESNHINIINVDDDEVNVNPSLVRKIEQGGSDLGTFAEFQLKIRSMFLESELDENTLKNYYKLCHSKKEVLHNKTLNLNRKLVAGIIGETVDIAGAVKACDIFTPTEKLEQWENSLRSFKLLGMKVEFLVNRVSHLLKLRVGFEGTRFADEMKILEAKRIKLKEAYEKVTVDVKNLKSKAEMYEDGKFQQVVNSPW